MKNNEKRNNKFTEGEMIKLLVCGCGAFSCLSYTDVITIPSFVSNTMTMMSNLSLTQIIVGSTLGLGTAIFTNETLKNKTNKNNKEDK